MRVNATCTLCDAPCDEDEALCPTCLADPQQRAAYEVAARTAHRIVAAARWRSAARAALQMARAYREEARSEGREDDTRVRACLEEVRRCRAEVRRAHAGDPAPIVGPGLRKAGAAEAGFARRSSANGAG